MLLDLIPDRSLSWVVGKEKRVGEVERGVSGVLCWDGRRNTIL